VYCYQCEQTKDGTGCTEYGVCGKDPISAALQDLLVYATKGIGMYAHRAGQLGASDPEIDRFTIEALFTTITNVNFDPERLDGLLQRAIEIRDKARVLYERAAHDEGQEPEALTGPATWLPAASRDERLARQSEIAIDARRARLGDVVVGLHELLTYGLKGAAAYADHALILGQQDEAVWAFFHEALDFLASEPTDVDALTSMCLRCGEVNLRVMELLDAANTGAYGMPVPTPVRIEPIAGKAILVSGHDLKDLEEILRQTEGRGINVYTHGEMLPAHGYPGLKKYAHLAGNYGGAWQDQQKEFDAFPGAILMTTNCIQKPRGSYVDRIFTSGLVAWPGVTHITNRDLPPGSPKTAPLGRSPSASPATRCSGSRTRWSKR
jgi:hydroxylamine reductase